MFTYVKGITIQCEHAAPVPLPVLNEQAIASVNCLYDFTAGFPLVSSNTVVIAWICLFRRLLRPYWARKNWKTPHWTSAIELYWQISDLGEGNQWHHPYAQNQLWRCTFHFRLPMPGQWQKLQPETSSWISKSNEWNFNFYKLFWVGTCPCVSFNSSLFR